MPRVTTVSPEEREALKKEITQEIRREQMTKRLVGLGGCLVALLLLLGVPMVYVAAQFAKTGFFDVPVLSKMLYKPTEPVRSVLPLYGSSSEAIYRVIGTKVQFNPATSLASIPVTESELTTLSQHGLAGAQPSQLPFPMKYVQVAVEPSFVEIYAVSPQEGRDATVRVRFRPLVKDNKLDADVQEIAIGSLVISSKTANAVFAVFGRPVMEAATTAIGNAGLPVNIELDPGVLRFVVRPKMLP